MKIDTETTSKMGHLASGRPESEKSAASRRRQNSIFAVVSGYKSLALLIIVWSLLRNLHAEQLSVNIQGESAILMNADTKVILFEKEAYKLSYPASTTKVATALYALKMKGNELDTMIAANQEALATITPQVKRRSNYTLPAYWLETDGCHIGIKNGEELSLRDLLKGMLITSGNDAANVIAQHIGGTIPQFMEQLNLFLKEMDCQQTHFCNPHGLHHPEHQTTAYDLALITKECLQYPEFCDIVSQPRFLRPKTNKQAAASLTQTNRLIRPGKFHYPKAIGVKTGHHSKAKSTFIGAARFNGRTLIAVLLGYADRQQLFHDSIKLFDAAFNQPKIHHVLLKAGRQNFSQTLPQAAAPLTTYLKEDLCLDYYPAEDPQAKCLLYWDHLPLPIQKDQQVGELQLVAADGKILQRAPLLALEGIDIKWPYNWLHGLKATSGILALSCSLVILTLIAVWMRLKKD